VSDSNRTTYHFGDIPLGLWESMTITRAVTLGVTLGLSLIFLMSHAVMIGVLVALFGFSLVFFRYRKVALIDWVLPLSSYMASAKMQSNDIPMGSLDLDLVNEKEGKKPPTQRKKREKINKMAWPSPIGLANITPVPVRSGLAGGWTRVAHGSKYITVCWQAELRQPFILLDTSDQERFVNAWGQVLASTCADGSDVVCISTMHRQVPDKSSDDLEWMQEHMSRNADNYLLDDYFAMRDQIGAAAATAEVIVGLTCEYKPNKNRKKKVDEDFDAIALSADEFERQMESAGFHMSLMSQGDIAELLRAVLIGEAIGPNAGRDPREIGPVAWEHSWKQMTLDGRTHRNYIISEWPRVQVGPTFVEPLVGAVTPRAVQSVTFHFFPQPARRAQARAKAAVTTAEAKMAHKSQKSILITAQDRQLRDVALRREQALSQGYAEHRLALIASLSVEQGDTKNLEKAEKALIFAAQKSQINLMSAWGRQLQTFAASLPFGLIEVPRGVMG
jgi:hypothetical protein